MELPLRLPPPGVSANFDNPEFLGTPVIVVAPIALFLIIFSAAGRVYSRVIVFGKWRFEEYIFCLTCALCVAVTCFSIAIVEGPNGHHSWDIVRTEVSKSDVQSLMSFWITLGPVFWLLKLNLFMFILNIFDNVRWFKSCVYVGIIITGIIFSSYTIVITMSCTPRNGTDTINYLQALNRAQCTSPNGANAIMANLTTAFNAAANVYILLLPFPLISTLRLTTLQKRGVYGIYGAGIILCICSLLGAIYRVKSWQTNDLTGAQIPHTALIITEIALSITITCIPSVYETICHFTKPDIDDRTTLATPKLQLLNSGRSTPQVESRATWRKTHRDIEEIPYREKPTSHPDPTVPHTRMKALPTTPFPLHYDSKPCSPTSETSSKTDLSLILSQPSPATPKTPHSPGSVHSMHLPIMLSPHARTFERRKSMQSMDLEIMLSPRAMDQVFLR
ncbi:hypothetical protein BU24DRAFT_414789 [Aaosphaeria arxii CBS 175.79]|uniref:Rhodopsin domain-containing protein n=1 Tax=Aaosphaeria arxii CBS 175.79 TaxID=1450172 RepID=A0A6A5X928_9PLEO|nr:uncharacterized protein BU24DRAFT_414789 [Aaosphaeria arxii CBS 175.79]KAF2009462.1 hypothetical protein BU24DRAFT_414789 [Aaosphaeria arxii CBS 175.79]